MGDSHKFDFQKDPFESGRFTDNLSVETTANMFDAVSSPNRLATLIKIKQQDEYTSRQRFEEDVIERLSKAGLVTESSGGKIRVSALGESILQVFD